MIDTYSDHQKYLELLPWYANDTLAGAEREALKAHLGECLSCRAALNDELRLRSLVAGQQGDPLGVRHGVAELQRRIDRRESRVRRRASHPLPAFGYAAAVVACVAVVLALLILPDDPARIASDESFGTLSDVAGFEANRIDVVLSAEPDAAALEQFLADFEGRVVSGPSDIGRYTIELDSGIPLDELLDSLRADSRVRFAGRAFAAGDAPDSESQ